VDRKALTAMLIDEFAPLAEEAGIALADTSAGFKPSLDMVGRIATALPTLHASWYEPLARWYLLDRIVKRLAVNMAVSVDSDSYSMQHIYEHAQALRAELFAYVGELVDPTFIAAILSGEAPPAHGRIVHVVTPFLTGPDYGGDEWSAGS
jgi:hypothetical protein